VEELSIKSISEDASPVIKLVNSTLYDALKAEASDIHLDRSGRTQYQVSHRRCVEHGRLGGGADTAEQVVSRIKVISGLDIAERRVPQDGVSSVDEPARGGSARVHHASIFGEDAVLRILDKQTLSDQIKGCASTIWIRRAVHDHAAQPVREPTVWCWSPVRPAAARPRRCMPRYRDQSGPGQDHHHRRSGGVPVARRAADSVNEKKGLTFERGLRSSCATIRTRSWSGRYAILRPPDRRAIGADRSSGIHDRACQQRVRCHRPFHAHGVDPYSFVSAMNGILAQRLVRVNCTHCVADDHPDEGCSASRGSIRHRPQA